MIISTTQVGKQIRSGRFRNKESGGAVIVAMDHGLVLGPIQGIERIEDAFEKVLPGKPDAVMMFPGSVKKCINGFLGKDAPALIIRLDSPLGARSVIPLEKTDQTANLFKPDDAIRIGASAIMTTLVVGPSPEEIERYNIEYIANQVRECEKLGFPIIIETLFVGRRAKTRLTLEGKIDLESLKFACREASEIGADFVKAPYAGSSEAMKEVVRSCSTPILVLGGPKKEGSNEILTLVKNSIDAGCIGCFVGRNVWQHEDPPKILRALRLIVHEKESVESIVGVLDL